jgi:hypothetical protein
MVLERNFFIVWLTGQVKPVGEKLGWGFLAGFRYPTQPVSHTISKQEK